MLVAIPKIIDFVPKNVGKIAVLAVSIIFYINALYSQEPPKETKTHSTKTKEERDTRGDKPKKQISITLIFCDQREVKGQWTFPTEEIQFFHSKESIRYNKKIQLRDLESIEIETWSLRKVKTNVDGDIYKFLPKTITIKTLTQGVFFSETPQQLPIYTIRLENNNGFTTFFSYWFDLKKMGKWDSGNNYENEQETKNCHKDVFRKLNF